LEDALCNLHLPKIEFAVKNLTNLANYKRIANERFVPGISQYRVYTSRNERMGPNY
jgi:hypothetical protein